MSRTLLRVAAAIAIVLTATGGFATTKTFTGPGNFSDPSRWGGTSPAAGEDLVISDGNTCTIDASTPATAFGSLTLGSTFGSATVVWASSGTSTLSVTTVINAGTGNFINMGPAAATGTLKITGSGGSVGSGTIVNCASGTIEYSGSSQTVAALTYYNLVVSGTATTNTFDVQQSMKVVSPGVFTPSASAVINSSAPAGTLSGDGTVKVTGTDFTSQYRFSTYSLDGGTAATSLTVDFAGTSAQTMNTGITYGNVKIENTTTTTVSGADVTVARDLGVLAGTLSLSTANNFNVGGALTIDGTISGSGTVRITSSTGSLTGAATGAMSVSVSVLANKTFNTTSGFTIGLNATGTLTIGAATVGIGYVVTNNGAIKVHVMDGTDSTSKWVNAAGSTLRYVYDTMFTTAGTLDASASGNTVIYQNNGPNTVFPTTYHHLTLATAGAKTLTGLSTVNGDFTVTGTATMTLPAGLTIGGNFSSVSGSSVNLGSGTVSVAGNFTAGGSSIGAGTSTLDFNGSSAQSIDLGTGSLKNVTFSNDGAKTATSSLTVLGNLTINYGATFTAPAINTLSLLGNFTNNGTFNASTSNVSLEGSTAQLWTGVNIATLNHLVINTVGITFSQSANVGGILSLEGANVTVANTKVLTVNSGGSIARVNTSYIIGSLAINLPASTLTSFPIGTTAGYAPVDATASAAGALTITAVAGAQPNATGTNVLSRYWTFGSSTIPSLDLVFHYNAIDVTGTEANYVLGRYSGAAWTRPTTTINTSSHTASAAGITAVSGDWTAGEPLSLGATSTTTLASSLNPSSFGQAVTFTATVSGSGATGTVTFNDGATSLSTAALTAGTSTFMTSALTAGTHSIIAVYSGDTNFASSTSAALTQVVNGAPVITGFSPTSGPIGTSVSITGSGFTGVTAVKFNGAIASYTFNSDMSRAIVPSGATTGPISVTTSAGTGTSSTNFTINPPSIASFTPGSGSIGTSVSITGSGFTGVTSVTFNGSVATYTVNSDTSLTVIVPSGATTGPISVITSAGTGTS
ncbi:MAG: Ig-like domain repeat protein, partial [Acidobacteriota bacterium]|nr:Ig-like domain repeat protein [Acidobacteriota bacterium]